MSSRDQDPDPGGSQNPSSREITDLKEQNEQQMVLIAQLKEVLRKTDQNTMVTDDKVQDYVKTLSRKKKNKGGTEEKSLDVSVDSNKNEKLSRLKQQMEENKAKLAERGKSQKGLEDMVSQLTVQFNDSQQLISQSPLNLSLQEAKSLDYNKNTPQEELYNILLSKEKKITDLTNKIQKLEVSVLDLQENLKEKDSVLDSRTKAITLMSESLSKKGKNTLDQLDETKEQMRKMQENFVSLEEDMKNRQLKLLEDLKMKNSEILDLQEFNAKLQEDLQESAKLIEELQKVEEPKESPGRGGKKKKKGQKGQSVTDSPLKTDFSELTNRLDELKALNEELLTKNKDLIQENNDLISQQQNLATENEELLVKIRDLDEQTRKTISELKGQIRESITSESTASDSDEVSKLKKQLDESNKNMIKIKAQHKSKVKDLNKKLDTFKKMGDANVMILQQQNDITKLEQKIAELEEEKGNLQLKMVESTESVSTDKLTTLEEDNQALKDQVKDLNEKLVSLTQSEMSNIQVEEKVDELEGEKKRLEDDKEDLVKENAELEEKLQTLLKEKTDLNIKLENYIQENMELIDKLEKLSAEKVSSAESIEIVEGLTQQEKLELAAYQENLEAPTEQLNESVQQLSEDSNELLHKIEMFNIERKEVMVKLDALKEENIKLLDELKDFEGLKEENNRLVVKLKEVENNRDVLEETYEQLQTEKDMLERQLEKGSSSADQDLQRQLTDLQEKCDELRGENKQLQSALKELNESVPEKDTDLREQLEQFQKDNNQLQSKMEEHLEEIDNYKTIIEEIKQELINSSSSIIELQNKLTEKDEEISAQTTKITELTETLTKLEELQDSKNNEVDVKVNENLFILEEQLNGLKQTLQQQIEQAQAYETELSEKQQIIEGLTEQRQQYDVELDEKQQIIVGLTEQTQQLKQQIGDAQEYESELIEKQTVIAGLNDELKQLKSVVNTKDEQIAEKDAKFKDLTAELTDKFLKLQQQFEGNNGTLEGRINELQTKNKELMEKLKKYAANLKKKNQEYKDLEQKLNEKNSDDLLSKLKELEEHNVQLQNTILSLKDEKSKESTVSLKQEFSDVQEQSDCAESQASVQDARIKELEMIVETQESDLSDYRNKISRLEEDLSHLEEGKQTLERTNIELGNKLMETSASFEEKSYEEEQLEARLVSFIQKDEQLSKKMETMTLENEELTLKNQDMVEEQSKYTEIITGLQEQLGELMTAQQGAQELEQTHTEIKKQVTNLENQVKFLQQENETLKQQSSSEFENYEQQLQEIVAVKNDVAVKHEKLQEEWVELSDKYRQLQFLVEELQEKLQESANDKDKVTELDNLLALSEEEVKSLKDKENKLTKELDTLRRDLLNSTASNVVDSVINEAETRVSSKETTPVHSANPEEIPTFTWSDQNPQSDWFAAEVQETVQKQHVTEATVAPTEVPNNSMDELLQKIKTLEFMLYSVEKEKDNALLQCHELSNELTRLVYEREHQKPESVQQVSTSLPGLEAQILSQVDVVDSENLRQLEFEPTTSATNPSNIEVVEEVCAKKEAYKCFKDGEELEGQIVSTADIMDNSNLRQLEYEPTTSRENPSTVEVVEESFAKKEAYQCFKDGEDGGVPEDPFGPSVSGQSTEGVLDDDDGWGWGPDEAKKEEAHLLQSQPADADLKHKLVSLTEQVRVYELEREQHLDEIKQLQVKSGKLIKKCKEFKLKYEQAVQKKPAAAAASDDFFMDSAIQDELKSQVDKLEKQLRELNAELQKERAEKANVAKQVDTLTSANEKLVELKERQEIELVNAQRACLETKQKLDNMEWENDGFEKPATSDPKPESSDGNWQQKYDESRKQVEELKDSLKDIMLDNEEMQSLLEEQRNLRQEAENKLKNVTVAQTNVVSEEEFIALQQSHGDWMRKYEEECQSKNDLQMRFMHIETNYENITRELSELRLQAEREKEQLQQEIVAKDENCRILTDEKQQIEVIVQGLEEQVSNLNEQIYKLRAEYDSLQEASAQLGTGEDLQLQLNNLQSQNQNLAEKNSQLQEALKQMHLDTEEIQQAAMNSVSLEDYNALKQKLDELESPKNTSSFFDAIPQADLNSQVQDLEAQVYSLNSQLNAIAADNAALKQQKAALEEELLQSQPKQELGYSTGSFFDDIQPVIPPLDTTHVQALEAENLQLKQQIQDDLNVRIEHLVVENQSLQQRIAVLETQLAEQQAFKPSGSFFDSVQPVDVANTDNLAKIHELEAENEYLKQQIAERQASLAEPAFKADSFFDSIPQAAVNVDDLNSQIHTLSEENKRLNEHIQVASSAQISEVQQLETENQSLKQRIADLETERAEQQAFTKPTSSFFDAVQPTFADTTTDNLNSKLQELEAENEQLKQKIAEHEAQIQAQPFQAGNFFDSIPQSSETPADDLSPKIQALEEENKRLTEQLQLTVDDLNQRWEEECVRRGDVIAETWKQHLDSVEIEFGTVKDSLQGELSDYEEKCNALVNENNELRKNVDAEIKNEVDQMSALQQQIANGQQSVLELTQALQQAHNNVAILQNDLTERQTKLDGLNVVIETTMRQFEEKREVVDDIVKILERNPNWVLSFEKQDIVKELLSQLDNHSERDNLQARINELETALANTEHQIELKLEELKQALEKLEEAMRKNEQYEIMCSNLQQQLAEKDQEIYNLSQKLHLIESVENDNNKDMHSIQQELEQTKNKYIELEQTLESVKVQWRQSQQNFDAKDQEVNKVMEDLRNLEEQCLYKDNEWAQLKEQWEREQAEAVSLGENKVRELENYYENLLLEKQTDYESLKQLNATLEFNQTSEGNTISQLHEQINNLTAQNKEYADYCQEWSLKAQEMSNQQQEAAVNSQSLEQKIGELEAQIVELNEQINAQTSEMNGQLNTQTTENDDLKRIIEGQVANIEELKQQLYEKSQEFDTMIAEVDISKQHVGTITQQPQIQADTSKSDHVADGVTQAELDLALYMLHQRDVRCEELTVELTQLLEERDTLQLRLSNAIREKEELRRKVPGIAEAGPSTSTGSFHGSPSKSGQIFMAASGIEVGTEPTEEKIQNLEEKLSELKRVGYKKDKTFVDEQEVRRIQQMAIMQEHINEASKLPPEAAQKLVDASYTLSRDVQSPSKVLLNWLWGRSTPKVNDT